MKIYILRYLILFLTIIPILLFVGPGISFSQENAAGMSMEQDFLVIEGKVSRVSPDSYELTVKPDKGKKIMVEIEPETIFIGDATSLQDIKKRQNVKVWFFSEGGKNKATKIEKIAELGC